jgi:MFS family permease
VHEKDSLHSHYYLTHREQHKSCELKPLHVALLLVTLVTTGIAYSIVLPVLPFLVEEIGGIRDSSLIALHTGFLTASYTLAIALGAPLWGKLVDRIGSKKVILIGLTGLGVTLVMFSLPENLYLTYAGRFLSGLFDSAIPPAAMIAVSRYKASDEWKARRLSWIGLASVIGALIGPIFGGVAVRLAERNPWAVGGQSVFDVPFLVAAALAFVVATLILLIFPANYTNDRCEAASPEISEEHPDIVLRLLMLAFIAALAISSFEVLLTMRAKAVLALDSYRIGLMFSECSLVMFLAQAIVFSPLVKPQVTRHLIVPALLLMIAGMWLIPFGDGFLPMMISVGMVAAGGGVVSPILIYWISLIVKRRQGETLGRQVAAASLGQAFGAAISGLLFGYTTVALMPFLIISVLIGAGLALSMRLPSQLAPFIQSANR